MLWRITLYYYYYFCCIYLLQDTVQGYQQAGDVAEKVDLHYEDKTLYHVKNDPMNIFVYYDSSINRMDTAGAAIIKCSLIPAAVEWVSKVIKVHKSHSKFLLERQCLNNFHRLIDGRRYCHNGCMAETKCGPITIPERHLHGCDYCSSGTDCTTRSANEKHTLKGDFVLYVSSNLADVKCAPHKLSASHCQQEKDFDRPVAGYLNFCHDLLINTPSAYDGLLSAVIHKLLHILSFSYELLPYFRDEQGLPRTARDSSGIPLIAGHWSSHNYKVNGVSLIKTRKQNNIKHTVTVISTPNVKREVKQHFQCESMIGAEVENQEAQETVYWEKRLFGNNELMTVKFNSNSVISRITLALLEDSGWYKVNYNYAGQLAWGQDKGCSFVNSSCGEWIQQSQNRNQNPSPFCDGKSHLSGDFSCTDNHKTIATCNLKNFSYPLPKEYQYFSENVFAGGSFRHADYCPFNEEYMSLNQMVQCHNIYALKDFKYIVGLESYGPRSACFEVGERWVKKLQHNKKEIVIAAQIEWGAGCYEYKCTKNSIVIIIGNSHFECNKTGKKIKISAPYNQFIHYKGSLICPEYDKLCQAYGCINMCSRHGSCVNNTCHCNPGFYGNDCRYSYQLKSKTCDEHVCENGGTCTDNDDMCGVTCKCPPQYSGSYCEQKILQDVCALDENYCNGHGNCTMNSDNTIAICQCHEGFTGTRCDAQQDYCTLHGNRCQNGGTCVSSSFNSFYCKCPGKYSGALCESEIDFCTTQPCRNGGTCINQSNGYLCQCTEQYTGKKCRHLVDDHCTPNPCHNGGTCQKSEGRFYCACLQGYTGGNCETRINLCSKNICQNETQCKTNSSTSSNNSINCFCSDANCSKSKMCNPTKCLNGGTCIEAENEYHCNCTPPYYGKRCENHPCNPNPCKNGGICSVKNSQFTCHCPPMFGGKKCKLSYTPQTMPCPLQTCNNGGVCKILSNNTRQCKCPPHLEGFRCNKEKNPCLKHGCKNNAECIPVGYNDYLCNCSNGFKGTKCKETDQCRQCKTNPCENGGECICKGKKRYWCRCPKGFGGNRCRNPTPSPVEPLCLSCTNCTANATSSCTCKAGYKCKHRLSCSFQPCQNGGTCIDSDNGFNCSCLNGYTGETCNISVHTHKCLNGGVKKVTLHGTEMCICTQGFSGTMCQYHDNNINPCTPDNCIHGSCIVTDDVYICQCGEGFTGKHCDQPDYCMLGYCMNGATCIYNDDHTFKCLCTGSFYGEFCTIPKISIYNMM